MLNRLNMNFKGFSKFTIVNFTLKTYLDFNPKMLCFLYPGAKETSVSLVFLQLC